MQNKPEKSDSFSVKEYPLNNGFSHGIFIGKKCVAKVRGKKVLNLFVAAPDLLAATYGLLEIHDDEAEEFANEAIAKAEGR